MAKFDQWSVLLLVISALLNSFTEGSPTNRTRPRQFAQKTSRSFKDELLSKRPESESELVHNNNENSQGSQITVPPHCARALFTVSQTSKLTKRATPPHNDVFPATQVSLNIGVRQSVCFRLLDTTTVKVSTAETDAENSPRLLHILTLIDLEQYYSITERYRFAIPELETRCLCECESPSENCLADEFKYGKCSASENIDGRRLDSSPASKSVPPSACYRTFFANQPIGSKCGNRASAPRLCCQLRFRPYQNRAFTALRLESATSSAVLQYAVFSWENKTEEVTDDFLNQTQSSLHRPQIGVGGWRELERRKIRVQLDGSTHNVILNEDIGLKLSILGISGAKSTGSQLESGMYFVENFAGGGYGELIGQMSVNRITEHDFHKLGWFRLQEDGDPFVHSGEILLDRVHHARADSCAEQRFRSMLDASYYVNADSNETTRFRLSEPLSRTLKWVRSARLFDSQERLAFLQVSEGISLETTLGTTLPTTRASQPRPLALSFVHNSSRLADFSAMLVVDRFSNSLLNLTVYNASGVLNGFIRRLDDIFGEEIDSFSVAVPSKAQYDLLNSVNPVKAIGAQHNSHTASATAIISLTTRIKPYPIHSLHIVCLRPDDTDMSRELCRPVQSVHYELEVNTMRNEWSKAIGDCPKCNQITVDGFMKYLNPANWSKGIASVSEAFMLFADIFGYLFVMVSLYVVVTKVVIPLAGCCCMCPSHLFFCRRKK